MSYPIYILTGLGVARLSNNLALDSAGKAVGSFSIRLWLFGECPLDSPFAGITDPAVDIDFTGCVAFKDQDFIGQVK
ncbi:hypothetical protein G8770_09450 [Aestuariicella hydrocarbonica]|uniref:Uncharacterized protein n=1 Tax=Pseudomaricurvus hydrocarbonicus TaxID=1470433 RepID=A0A9E5MM94_9GAMM|nr:hypothetical protein [Aestuariicella hydrocarbonica]NHO65765.1 hypothetical protein [Aestuariicella hydrocarbonica]